MTQTNPDDPVRAGQPSRTALRVAVLRAAHQVPEIMEQRAASVGEPWLPAFEPAALRQLVLDLGFGEAEIYEPDALNRRYLHRRKDGLTGGGRLLLARV